MAKGHGAGPRLTLQSETHQGAALGISRQDGRVTDRAQPCRPRCQRRGSGTDRWWRWCGRERQRVARKPLQMIWNCFRVTPRALTAEASSVRAVPWAPGRILPFLSPWGPHVGACTHHRQHPEPQQLVRETVLPPQTGASTALTCNLLCPASPLGDRGHFSAQERHQPRRPGNDTHMR